MSDTKGEVGVTDGVLNDVLGRVPVTRRNFVRKTVLGSAFAAPFVASFDMRTMDAGASTVANQCLIFNQSAGLHVCVTANQSNGAGVNVGGVFGFTTPNAPSANTVILSVWVGDCNPSPNNISSESLPVTLVSVDSTISGYSPDIKLPAQLGFKPSSTLPPAAPGGYYVLAFNIKGVPGWTKDGSDFVSNGSLVFRVAVGLGGETFTVGQALVVNGPSCSGQSLA